MDETQFTRLIELLEKGFSRIEDQLQMINKNVELQLQGTAFQPSVSSDVNTEVAELRRQMASVMQRFADMDAAEERLARRLDTLIEESQVRQLTSTSR